MADKTYAQQFTGASGLTRGAVPDSFAQWANQTGLYTWTPGDDMGPDRVATAALSNLWAGGTPTYTDSNASIPTLNDLASQKYEFDPNQYLPQIQQTAASIYDPQKAQLEALRAISTNQAEEARITTKKDFAKQLESEIEAINRRGAFFSGGALRAETDIRTAESSALKNINFQELASQAGFLAQQAGLSAAQAQYIQERLTESETSAYARFQDYRNFLLNLTQEQRRQYEDDREFQENVRQFGLQYALDKKRLKQSKSSK